MTGITAGPPWPADGPLPVAPAHNLLTLPGAIQLDPDPHVFVGIEEWPYPRDLPDLFETCSTGTFRVKQDSEGWNLPIFPGFTAYLPIECTAAVAKTDGFADRARVAFQAREHWAVHDQLVRGLVGSPTVPYLADANVKLPAGSTAQRPDVGLAYLEEAIGNTAQAGVIHATNAVATAWNGNSGYEVEDTSGVLYTTANRTPVAVSSALVGVQPHGGSAAGAHQQWVFASSRIQVYQDSEIRLIGPTLRESLDRSDNLVVYFVERAYVVTYDAPETSGDRPVQAAVKIDWAA